MRTGRVGRRRAVAAGAVLPLVALAGCGGTSVGDAPSRTLLPSPSPSASTASVAEYASVVARQRDVVTAAVRRLEPCAADPGDPVCRTYLPAVEARARTLDRRLESASVDGGRHTEYLGLPPGDIAALLAATRAAAQEAQAAAKAAARCSLSCADEMATAVAAAHDLESQLDAWDRYR